MTESEEGLSLRQMVVLRLAELFYAGNNVAWVETILLRLFQIKLKVNATDYMKYSNMIACIIALEDVH